MYRNKMSNTAIHKSKDKKRKGGAGAENEYARRLKSLDENEDVPLGRITKMLRADRFMVTYYDAAKRQVVEVQSGVVDRNIQRLKPSVGNYVVPVESGGKYEIYLVLNDEDARRRSKRIHSSILNMSSSGSSEFDDLGIEFTNEEAPEPEVKETEEEKKNKRDKVAKHVERVVRLEADASDGDGEVDVDNI